jgi:(+)-pinoresinol hydroxylase
VIPTMYWLRAFVLILALPITRNVETNKKNRAAMNRLIQVAAGHGWGEYRTPPAFQDAVVGAYSFNNHALLRLHETIKDAVDPNGIISAGRYGIWPKHLRRARA